jgi:hypothetical protein
VSVATVAVSPSDLAAYAQLRASVPKLIDGYQEVATMFATSYGSTAPMVQPR